MGVSYGKIVWPLVGVVLLLSTATLQSRNVQQNAIIFYTNQALLFALYYAEYFLLSVPVLFWLAWRLMGRSWCGYTLCKAAAGNKLDEVRGLLRAGLADICYTDVHGGTALHYASANGHAAVARLLVEAGGQRLLLMCLKNGFNCLHLAAENGHLEVAKELFKICAPAKWKELLMQPANNGMSCLSPAVHKEHLEVVKLLVQKGGKELVQMQEKDGTSCLQVSVCKKRVDILQVLLNSRADPDLENEHGRTALHDAAFHGQKDAATALLSAGADPQVQDVMGWTPFDLAREQGHTSLLSLLESAQKRQASKSTKPERTRTRIELLSKPDKKA